MASRNEQSSLTDVFLKEEEEEKCSTWELNGLISEKNRGSEYEEKNFLAQKSRLLDSLIEGGNVE